MYNPLFTPLEDPDLLTDDERRQISSDMTEVAKFHVQAILRVLRDCGISPSPPELTAFVCKTYVEGVQARILLKRARQMSLPLSTPGDGHTH